MKEEENKILVINSGSSTVKFQVISLPSEKVLIKGMCDAVGQPHAEIIYEMSNKKKIKKSKPKNHEEALKAIIEIIKEEGIVSSLRELKGIGHRAVHGGETFKEPSLITEELIRKMEELSSLAPLHNPPNIMGMKILKRLAPEVKQVAVFDTAFHSHIPPRAYLYGLPYNLYEKYKIRRYGFHGTSHNYIGLKVSESMGKSFEELRIISCHLGNGASITAIKNGKSIDTSMGFTPLEGLIMGTRCGDIDPSIPLFLQTQVGLSIEEVAELLNKSSGLLGISGVSSDMRVIKAEARKGNKRAILARDIYAYKVKKYIGAYLAVMGGADAIAFTGGIGENDAELRENILSGMEELGIKLDRAKNMKGEREINTDDSKVKLFVIPTNEEIMIAKETLRIMKENE